MKNLLHALPFVAAISCTPFTVLRAQPGGNDAAFNVADLGRGIGDGASGEIRTMLRQADGRLILAGWFSAYDGQPAHGIVRLHADGGHDASFDAGAGSEIGVIAMDQQPDGKLILGGEFSSFNGTPAARLVRLYPDGSTDPTFSAPPVEMLVPSMLDLQVSALRCQPDGRILVAGAMSIPDGGTAPWIGRLNSDGSQDLSFAPSSAGLNGDARALELQPDGKVLVGGRFTEINGFVRKNLARLNSDGTTDASFDPGSLSDNAVSTILLQADGRILVGGDFTLFSGLARNCLTRLLPDGNADLTFNIGTGFTDPDPAFGCVVSALAIGASNSIMVGGTFTRCNGIPRGSIARLLSDGSVDPAFDSGAGFRQGGPAVNTLLMLPADQVLAGGFFQFYGSIGVGNLARLNADASIDMAFDPGTGANAPVTALALQPDGRLIVAGDFTRMDGAARNHIARLHTDGTLDSGFDPGTGFTVIIENAPTYLALQADGKVIVSGGFDSYDGAPIERIVRLNSDGSLDPTFSGAIGGGPLLIQPDGRIITGRHRLNPDGSLDATFSAPIGDEVFANLLLPDGRIMLAGRHAGAPLFTRLNADGSIDPTFDSGAGFDMSAWLNVLALEPDGKVIVGGRFTNYRGVARKGIVRVSADGSIDPSFDPGSGIDMPISDPEALAMALQPSGHLLLGGRFTSYNGIARAHIVRVDHHGAIDMGFDPGSGFHQPPFGTVHALQLQPDGNVVVGGAFVDFNGIGRNRLARLLGGCVAGTPCDDDDPDTANDLLDADCTCSGTVVDPCTENILEMEFQADGVSTIAWTVYDQMTGAPVQSDGGPLVGSPVIGWSFCLYDGCYRLAVTDDGGDGIAGGGYLLRTVVPGIQRVIDNSYNFSTGTVSAIANHEGFCLPLGADRLILSSCDKLDWRTSPCSAEYVYANDNPAVTAQYGVSNATSGYQMWWYDPNGGFSFKRFQSHLTANGLPVSATRACGFRINAWSGNQLAQGVLYNVKVRGRVAGVYSAWGPACRFGVDNALAQCPRTKLLDLPGNPYLSCGQSRAIGSNQLVHARPVRRMRPSCSWQNANRYQFRFRVPAENVMIVKTSGTNQYFVNTLGLPCGKTFEVDVRASFDNGATWCHSSDPYGEMCLLTTTCVSGMVVSGGFPAGEMAELLIYPNPNHGDALTVRIASVAEGVEMVSADIYDAVGKRVLARRIPVQSFGSASGGCVSQMIDLDGVPDGLYLVSISAGSQCWNQRLVIRK